MKHKKIFFIFVLFLILFSTVSYGANYPPYPEGYDITDYFIFEYDGSIYLASVLNRDNVYVGHQGSSHLSSYMIYGTNLLFILQDNNWVFDDDSFLYDSGHVLIPPDNSKFTVLMSTFNINYDGYWANQTGTEVFSPAPQGVIADSVETVEMNQVMKEILGILPLILVVVVSLVGLRKALSMLLTLLRRS